MVIEANKYQEVGFVKYSGEGLDAGVIDAGSAGSALLGLDEAIRFFNARQSPDLAAVQYDIPVRTRSGSWEAVVLAATAVGGAFALGYAKKAGEKLAENDFKDIGLKHVLQKSMSALRALVQLIKHTRRPRGWEAGRIEPAGPIDTVVVVNSIGEELLVPVEFFKWYQQIPPRLLVKMTSVVRRDRVLTIGSLADSRMDEITIVEEDKPLFDNEEAEDLEEDVLFPDLIHGSEVRLEGRLIRGNEASNTFGLEFQGHILNCVPAVGSVRQYKPALFLRCLVEGRVTRYSKSRFFTDRRPTLIVSKVVPLEEDKQIRLFGG